jgi:hypothetical protein
MFNPSAVATKSGKAAKKKALAELKTLCEGMIPTTLHEGMIVDVKEVVCGDPSCAPIDTVFTFLWQSGGKGTYVCVCVCVCRCVSV